MLVQKSVLVLSILGGSMAFAQNIVHQPVNPNGVTPVHTSLDHISILNSQKDHSRCSGQRCDADRMAR